MARKKHLEDGHSESWLVSYCDMISLLVTFFLMMMTFSTKDSGDIKEIGVGLLKGRGGVWPSLKGSSFTQEIDPEVIAALAEDLDGLNAPDGSTSVAFQPVLDGLLVHFSQDACFAPGSVEIHPALERNLKSLARVLARFDQLAVVEGSTDASPEDVRDFASPEALGAARAQAAARVMLSSSTLVPEQLQIASPGRARPRSEHDTAASRATGRRVEVRILSLSRSRAAQLQREARTGT